MRQAGAAAAPLLAVKASAHATVVRYPFETRKSGVRISRVMNPTKELLQHLFEEQVSRARDMPPEAKLLEGPRLFDRTCRLMMDGIRHRHPEFDEAEAQAMLRWQLDLAAQLERHR